MPIEIQLSTINSTKSNKNILYSKCSKPANHNFIVVHKHVICQAKVKFWLDKTTAWSEIPGPSV